MSSEDKLIESLEANSLESYLCLEADLLTPYCLGEEATPKMDICLPAHLHQAASELSRRASRIEELEKALDRAIGQFERLEDLSDSLNSSVLSELATEGARDAQAALSDHPDKEGGK